MNIEARRHAIKLFEAAISAADPARALQRAVSSRPFPTPDPGGRQFVVAIGKAAPAMLETALKMADDPIALGVCHHENTAQIAGVEILRAGHPVPDEAGLIAGQRIMDMLSTATEKDRVIALISGGGSALVPAPVSGVSLSDKQTLNRLLLEGGLDIVAMNLVRQQVSELKGGGFLRHATPAPVTAYILSDVIGNDLRAIASGPTVGPIGTRQNAIDLMKEAEIWEKLPLSIKDYLSKPGNAATLPKADNILIGSNKHSLQAMAAIDGHIASDALIGDVDDAAHFVLRTAQSAVAGSTLLFGGETTVKLKGSGLGGRNQEMALRIAAHAGQYDLPKGWVFLSGGTDGRDGPTDAAGGIVDGGTIDRIRATGESPETLLDNNDSYRALGAAGDLLITAATGTNVADVQVMILPA